ncbi:hypothetical protein U1Q18_021077 [Sarracenia purpurea var. burkii]
MFGRCWSVMVCYGFCSTALSDLVGASLLMYTDLMGWICCLVFAAIFVHPWLCNYGLEWKICSLAYDGCASTNITVMAWFADCGVLYLAAVANWLRSHVLLLSCAMAKSYSAKIDMPVPFALGLLPCGRAFHQFVVMLVAILLSCPSWCPCHFAAMPLCAQLPSLVQISGCFAWFLFSFGLVLLDAAILPQHQCFQNRTRCSNLALSAPSPSTEGDAMAGDELGNGLDCALIGALGDIGLMMVVVVISQKKKKNRDYIEYLD